MVHSEASRGHVPEGPPNAFSATEDLREVSAVQRLQAISTRLIEAADDVDALYVQMLEAAVAIMGATGGSVQRLDKETGELVLLAARSLDTEAEAYWHSIDLRHGSVCGAASRAQGRVVVEDLDATALALGEADLRHFRRLGIRALQSTPLVSREGALLGMISTYWSEPTRPAEADLRLLDVIARQAADLIERARINAHLQREVDRARIAEANSAALAHELAHRVKNTLATVQSIALQTLHHADSKDAFGETFLARLAALASTHDLLLQSEWQGAELHPMLERELSPYGAAGTRWIVQGPVLQLGSSPALALGMALHELATNAAKYGALSSAAGHVRVQWQRLSIDARAELNLIWSEHDGPRVQRPSRRGFGSRLLEWGLVHQLQADVQLAFEPDGLRCRIRIPLGDPAVRDGAGSGPPGDEARAIERLAASSDASSGSQRDAVSWPLSGTSAAPRA